MAVWHDSLTYLYVDTRNEQTEATDMYKFSISVDTMEPLEAIERRIWVNPIAHDANGARMIAKQHVSAVYPDLHIVRVHAWSRNPNEVRV